MQRSLAKRDEALARAKWRQHSEIAQTSQVGHHAGGHTNLSNQSTLSLGSPATAMDYSTTTGTTIASLPVSPINAAGQRVANQSSSAAAAAVKPKMLAHDSITLGDATTLYQTSNTSSKYYAPPDPSFSAIIPTSTFKPKYMDDLSYLTQTSIQIGEQTIIPPQVHYLSQTKATFSKEVVEHVEPVINYKPSGKSALHLEHHDPAAPPHISRPTYSTCSNVMNSHYKPLPNATIHSAPDPASLAPAGQSILGANLTQAEKIARIKTSTLQNELKESASLASSEEHYRSIQHTTYPAPPPEALHREFINVQEKRLSSVVFGDGNIRELQKTGAQLHRPTSPDRKYHHPGRPRLCQDRNFDNVSQYTMQELKSSLSKSEISFGLDKVDYTTNTKESHPVYPILSRASDESYKKDAQVDSLHFGTDKVEYRTMQQSQFGSPPSVPSYHDRIALKEQQLKQSTVSNISFGTEVVKQTTENATSFKPLSCKPVESFRPPVRSSVELGSPFVKNSYDSQYANTYIAHSVDPTLATLSHIHACESSKPSIIFGDDKPDYKSITANTFNSQTASLAEFVAPKKHSNESHIVFGSA